MLPQIINRIKANKEFKDTIYLYILQIVDKITPLAIVPYLMFILGAEKYGYIGFATAIVQYVLLFVEFGFHLSATKRVAIAKEHGTEELSRIFYATVVSKAILLLISSVVILTSVLVIPSLRIYMSTILCMYPLVIGTTFTFGWFYQGMGKIRIAAIVTSVCKLLVLPLIFVFIQKTSDYNTAAFIQSSVYLLASIVTGIILYRMHVVKKVKITFRDVIVEMRESYPLFLSSVATSVYTQLFTLILGVISTPMVVGKYSAADRIMRSLCFAIYSPVTQVYYPKISSLSYTNNREAKRLLKKLVRFMFVVMLALSLILFCFAEPVSALLGSDYAGLHTLLRIIAFVPIAIALGAVYGQMGLIALGNRESKRAFQKVYFMAAPFSLISVAILSILYTGIGAAIALSLTEYFVFFFMLRYYRKFIACC
ncbi:oligosaccharide flippase family protein [Bacteroides fluxus]|uniref:oligosaccharide flippase family protein n=1 Tax=Bacteroides fluxus TaxID=626930 RepID=UPI0023574DF7|nr:oligosaccharide flippase family protein [Bacteroides fluxus]